MEERVLLKPTLGGVEVVFSVSVFVGRESAVVFLVSASAAGAVAASVPELETPGAYVVASSELPAAVSVPASALVLAAVVAELSV